MAQGYKETKSIQGDGAPTTGDALCTNLSLFPIGTIYTDSVTGIVYVRNAAAGVEADWVSSSGEEGGSSYLVYTALISQLGIDDPQTITSGLLTIGVSYQIDTYVSGDDFTNVGAPSNESGVRFVATGTTPAIWTNETEIGFNTGAPIVVSINQDGEIAPLQNTLGSDIFWAYEDVGIYNAVCENAFPNGKVVCFASLNYGDGVGSERVALINRQGDHACDLYLLDSTFTPLDGFNEMSIEIRVFP